MRRTTLLDTVAVDTSTATVSRVMSNSTYPVSETLRQRMHTAADQLDYLPNQAGSQLKTRMAGKSSP